MTRTAVLLGDSGNIHRVYGDARLKRLAGMLDLRPGVATVEDLGDLRDTEVIFSTWGMPALTEAQLDALPSLRVVFYAAGSVKAFAGPLLGRGVAVASAWRANAVPVAEFTLAQALLGCKGYFRNVRAYHGWGGRTDPQPFAIGEGESTGPGVYGARVALLGLGAVGQKVAELLRPFELEVCAVDPYAPEALLESLGVRRIELGEAFATAQVVSNHLPDLPATKGAIRREHFEAMLPGGVFINTGRGAQVVEQDLIDVLGRREDLTALLDVTDPEPAAAGSALYAMPNVRLSSHIAGSLGDELGRMADCVIDECGRYLRGEPLEHAVTESELAKMA